MSKLCFIDTETTGLNPKSNGLIQLAGSIEIDHEVKENFNWFVKPLPSDIVEDKALEVNGITREQMAGFPGAREIYNRFTLLLSKYVDKFEKSDKFQFIAYNARFDYDFMRAWFEKLGDKYFGSWFFFPPIDVMNLAATSLYKSRGEMKNFKLLTVAEHVGIETSEEEAHDAMYDINLTKELYRRISCAIL